MRAWILVGIRIASVGLAPAIAWELAAVHVGHTVVVFRAALVIVIYGIMWELAARGLCLRSNAWRRWVAGALFPYVLLAASVVGLWLLPFIVAKYFWLFTPAGLLAAAVDRALGSWLGGGVASERHQH